MNASVDDVKEFVAENTQSAIAMAESFFRTSADQLEYWEVPPTAQVSGLGGRVMLIAAPKSERSSHSHDRPQETRREERRPEERSRDRGDRDRGGDRERSRGRGGDRGDRDRGPARSEARKERDTQPAPRPAVIQESPNVGVTRPLGEVGKFMAGLVEKMKLSEVTVSEAEAEDGAVVVTLGGRAITSLAEREPRLVAALSHLAHRAAEALLDDDNATALVEIHGARRPPRDEPSDRGSRDGRRDQRREGGRPRGERSGRSGESEDRDIDEVELERLAKDVARSVRESGEAELLPPMNSRERWFVHNALKDERGVRSESEGEGARKRIKILPA